MPPWNADVRAALACFVELRRISKAALQDRATPGRHSQVVPTERELAARLSRGGA